MTSDDFAKAKIANNWNVFSKQDIDLFLTDVSKSTQEDLEKAKKDISKLVPKIVVDSIGRSKTVYVKPINMISKQTKVKKDEGSTDLHEEAMNRFHHNTKVQRMGREAAFKQVERHYGKEITDNLREMFGMKATEPINSKVAEAAQKQASEEVKKNEVKSDISYTTLGNNKITVHPDALVVLADASGEAPTQASIDRVKEAFVSYMEGEDYSKPKTIIAFHKFLKTGNNEQTIADNADGGEYYAVDMADMFKRSVKKPDKPKDEKKGENVDPDALITKYADIMAANISKNGMKVDAKWKSGLENNFKMLKQYIDDSDYGSLKDFLVVKNQEWRNFYQEYTGITLPATDKETASFLFKHTGAINSKQYKN